MKWLNNSKVNLAATLCNALILINKILTQICISKGFGIICIYSVVYKYTLLSHAYSYWV